MLPIHSIETFWTHEWPWIRLIIFTQWCNFKCIYCENPDTIPTKKLKKTSIKKIIEIINKQKNYIKKKWWVTISWWEPLLHAKEILPLFKKLKNDKIHTAIDTNASILNEDVKELLNYTDLIMTDIKHIDNNIHKKITWQQNTETLKFIKYLEEIKKRYWIRYVLIHWYSDQEKYIKKLWEKISTYKYMERLELLPYHELWKYKREEMWRKYKLNLRNIPNKDKINKTKKILLQYSDKIFVR